MSTACSTGRHGNHDVYDADCPCRDLLDVLASKWSALVIGALHDGSLRFGELQRRVGGVNPEVADEDVASTRALRPRRTAGVRRRSSARGLRAHRDRT